MSSGKQQNDTSLSDNKDIHYALQLLALSLLLYFCFEIIKPFFTLFLWGTVLAITLYPLHKKLTSIFKGRKWISAIIITIVMYLLIIGPATMLTVATIDEFKVLKEMYEQGQLQIPKPDEEVRNWPVIGNYLFDFWKDISTNISGFYLKHKEAINNIAIKTLGLVSNAGMGILLLMGSFLVAGLMLVYGEQGAEIASHIFLKLAGKQGEAMENTVAVTVRSVSKGVIGVAIIQGLLAGIGLVLAGVPLAGLWAMIGMVLCIVQVGFFPVSIGVIIYIWTSGSTTTAIILTLWMLFVGVVDNILKPLMMGIGVPVPMLVVFIGTIGGFILNGFIGLFTGAIVLTIGYQLFMSWLDIKPETAENNKPDKPENP